MTRKKTREPGNSRIRSVIPSEKLLRRGYGLGIPERLVRVIKSYVNSWLGRSLGDFESDEFAWPDEEEPGTGEIPPRKPAGRPLDARLKRYYSRLEIPIGSDLVTVRHAWKQMMKQYHPDRYGKDPEKLATATRLCQELTEAYLELSRFLKEPHV